MQALGNSDFHQMWGGQGVAITADLERVRLTRALVRAAAGEASALEDIYRRTSAKLFGVVLRILGDRSEAEDVLQEVYITVWNRAGSFDPERGISPITWLAAVARNRAIDRVRARAVRQTQPIEAAAEVADSAPPAWSGLEADDDARRLNHCLEGLEQRQASAIRTAFYEGLTYEALSRKLNVPLGTVKSWIRRGLAGLKACLDS
jgi:RNA polymerase sigma-70 factor (ECF subfamily)